jgi:hypothetical protein
MCFLRRNKEASLLGNIEDDIYDLCDLGKVELANATQLKSGREIGATQLTSEA